MPDPIYEAKYGKGPHQAADAVVFNHCGEILLIKRSDNGLCALAGGFVEPGEAALDTARRETLEETGIDLSGVEPYQSKVFGAVDRDPRSWIKTTVFYFRVDLETSPKAGDDATNARWEKEPSKCRLYADHAQIIAAA